MHGNTYHQISLVQEYNKCFLRQYGNLCMMVGTTTIHAADASRIMHVVLLNRIQDPVFFLSSDP
jgi:hypothetical protein